MVKIKICKFLLFEKNIEDKKKKLIHIKYKVKSTQEGDSTRTEPDISTQHARG